MNVIKFSGMVIISALLTFPVFSQETNEYVDFSFDNVDIQMLCKTVGELTGKSFIIPNSVNNKVTIVSPKKIKINEVYPLFLQSLESSGYTILENNGNLIIVPLQKNLSSAPFFNATNTSGIATKIYKINNIPPQDFKQMINPFFGVKDNGNIIISPKTGHIIVTDTSENLVKLDKIIETIDVGGLSKKLEVVTLQFASAEEMAKQLNLALNKMRTISQNPLDKVKRVENNVIPNNLPQINIVDNKIENRYENNQPSLADSILIIPSLYANSLVVVAPENDLPEIKRIIALLDTEGYKKNGPINVIFLNFLDATVVAKNFNEMLARDKDGDNDQSSRSRGFISIEADVANNALVITSSGRDFEWLAEIVKKLDNKPKQVVIEVLIAEVTSDKDIDFGFDWASGSGNPESGKYAVFGKTTLGGDTVNEIVKNQAFPAGMTLGLIKGDTFNIGGQKMPIAPVILRAMQKNSSVKIMANVPIWAQNNVEASVNIVDNIPMLKSTVDNGGGTALSVVQNIDRKDIGIKIKLTPHINPNGDITMQLKPSIEAVTDPGEAGKYTPTFAAREVNTTVTIPNKSTIIISGLYREDKLTIVNKIPLLGDIPFLGVLFRNTSDELKKSNLLIFVSPKIVDDQNMNEVKKNLIERADLLKPSVESLQNSPTNITSEVSVETRKKVFFLSGE